MQIPIFLINLKVSTERLNKSTERLAKQNINFKRVEGVLGLDLNESQILKNYSAHINQQKYHTPLTKGQIGCYLSHRKAWQLIADSDAEFGIVLEDDFILSGDLQKAIQAIQSIKFNWDLIKLAAYQDRERKIAFKEVINNDFNIIIHEKPMSGGAATAITKKAAQRLLTATNQFGRPCDTDIQHFWETKVKVMSLMPYPVKQDMDFESTISAKKESQKKYFWRRKVQQLIGFYKNKKAVKDQIEEFIKNNRK